MDIPSGFRIALFSVLMVAGTWAIYWPRIKAHRVPERPIGFQVAMGAGIVLALVSLGREAGVAGAILAVLAIVGAGFFLFSSLASGLPAKVPSVAIGDAFVPFVAKDESGSDFNLGGLAGRPFLLKFFRGHW